MKQALKRVVGPLYRQKKWLEKIQYYGRTIHEQESGHQVVRETMASGPSAFGKIGESELRGLRCYLKNRDSQGNCNQWDSRSERLYTNAGVFPNSAEAFTDYAKIMMDMLPDVDCLAVWYNQGEANVINKYCKEAQLVSIQSLEPQLWSNPWLNLFEDKKVLAVSPFTDSIIAQQDNLKLVWSKKPEMMISYQLETIKTPLAAVLVPSPYANWKEGYEDLCSQMDAIDFDVALIGAGAWSLPLAVHAKRTGKIGIHLGGPTQIVFGVVGSRWLSMPEYRAFFNEHWIHPGDSETPGTFEKIEGGCYW